MSHLDVSVPGKGACSWSKYFHDGEKAHAHSQGIGEPHSLAACGTPLSASLPLLSTLAEGTLCLWWGSVDGTHLGGCQGLVSTALVWGARYSANIVSNLHSSPMR